MPTVPETPWGHWGNPSPVPAWEDGPAQIHGETGGLLKPGYADTLKWYYKKARNPGDRDHCLKLLTKLTIEQDNSKRRASVRRPQTAPRSIHFRQPAVKEKQNIQAQPAASASLKSTERKVTYQQQLAATQRLSRPKTVKYRTTTTTTTTTTQEVKKEAPSVRPKSAMARFEKSSIAVRRVNDPYLTTHESEYPGYGTNISAQATRPMTSRAFTEPYQLSDPIGNSTNGDEFRWKIVPKTLPIRSGTSSGNRRNKPHPDEAFMVWKFPHRNHQNLQATPAGHRQYRKLTEETMNQLLKDQMKSTYQTEFLGLPQGFHVNEAIDAPGDWRASLPRPRDTTVRQSYITPQQPPELQENTTRYGCSKNKNIPICGAVPTVTRDHVTNQDLIKSTTTYQTTYGNSQLRPDMEKILRSQTNKNVMNSFLRFSTIPAPETNEEKSL